MRAAAQSVIETLIGTNRGSANTPTVRGDRARPGAAVGAVKVEINIASDWDHVIQSLTIRPALTAA